MDALQDETKEQPESLVLLKAFVIRTQDLPKSLGIRISSSAEVGIVSASFSSEDPFNFIIGCHGGAVFMCSLDSPSSKDEEVPLDESLAGVKPASPIRVSYAPHRTHLASVQFCPALRNIFLSASCDGEVRIHSMLDVKPLAVVHCQADLISASWSPSSRSSESGDSHFYCLLKNGLLGRFNFTPKEEKVSMSPTYCLPTESGMDERISLFSTNSSESGREEMAVYSGRRDISIWQLKY